MVSLKPNLLFFKWLGTFVERHIFCSFKCLRKMFTLFMQNKLSLELANQNPSWMLMQLHMYSIFASSAWVLKTLRFIVYWTIYCLDLHTFPEEFVNTFIPQKICLILSCSMFLKSESSPTCINWHDQYIIIITDNLL